MSTHGVAHDPAPRSDGELPLDRALHTALVATALGPDSERLPECGLRDFALLLSGCAQAVADDVRRCLDTLPPGRHEARIRAGMLLGRAERHLTVPVRGTLRCVRNRALLVRNLYNRLDQLPGPAPRSTPSP